MNGGVRISPVLVGRDDLLAHAERRLGSAREGAGHMLLLAGEAGVGKTRLLGEIERRALARDYSILRCGAFPRDTEVAGGVLVDLARALRSSADPGVAGAGREMAARLAPGGPTDGDGHRRRRLLTADLADLVAVAAAGTDPVLLGVEDLHWADDLTLEVLARLARDLGRVPMLVVGTYRSDELYPRTPMRAWRARLVTQRLAEEVRLPRLGPEATAAMAAAISGANLPALASASLYERSDGIPLHIEELLPTLAAAAPAAHVPDTLAEAVLARAEALSPVGRALAEAACAIGRSFDLDLLTAIADMPPEAMDQGLSELSERFFVQPRGDGGSYDFRHALIGDAIYASLPPHQRRRLHARVAAASAAAGFSDAFVSEQYERARQPGPAFRHALAAAAEAAAVSAHCEAVGLYRRARRTAPAATPERERVALLTALATELAATDDNAEAAALYEEAYRLHRHLGDDLAAAEVLPALVAVRHLLGDRLSARTARLREGLSLVDSGSTRVRLLAAMSAAHMLDRRLDEAMRYGEQARDLATRRGDATALFNIDVTIGAVYVMAGRMEPGWTLLRDAIRQAREARAEAEAARGYRMIGSGSSVLVEYGIAEPWLREGIEYADQTERWNDRHYMAAHLAHVHWATGAAEAASRQAAQARADGSAGVTTHVTVLHVLGYLAMGRGDWAGATAHLDEAYRLGTRMDELQRLSPALWGLAETALLQGHVDEAIARCEEGYAASAAVEDAVYMFPYVVTGTRAYLRRGEPTNARDWLDRTGRLILLRGIPGTLPALDHAHGLLHLAGGQTGKARESLTRAADAWRGRRREWEGVRALLDLATCAVRSRRPAEAAAVRAEARERATSAGMVALIPSSEAAAPDTPSPLTAREVEVARLIATGATNREIAATLFIAPKTVSAHVEHILTKLGASRRAEIAAWTAAHPPRS